MVLMIVHGNVRNSADVHLPAVRVMVKGTAAALARVAAAVNATATAIATATVPRAFAAVRLLSGCAALGISLAGEQAWQQLHLGYGGSEVMKQQLCISACEWHGGYVPRS